MFVILHTSLFVLPQRLYDLFYYCATSLPKPKATGHYFETGRKSLTVIRGCAVSGLPGVAWNGQANRVSSQERLPGSAAGKHNQQIDLCRKQDRISVTEQQEQKVSRAEENKKPASARERLASSRS